MTPIFSLMLYSRVISQTDKTFWTDNPLHDRPPALIFLPNLHAFIFAQTQQTSTTKEPWCWNPPWGLDLILSKSNCTGRDNIFPFLFLSSQQCRGSKETRGGRENKEEEELERKRAGEENKTRGDGERQTRRRGGRSQTGSWRGEKRRGEKQPAVSFKKKWLQESSEEITTKALY